MCLIQSEISISRGEHSFFMNDVLLQCDVGGSPIFFSASDHEFKVDFSKNNSDSNHEATNESASIY